MGRRPSVWEACGRLRWVPWEAALARGRSGIGFMLRLGVLLTAFGCGGSEEAPAPETPVVGVVRVEERMLTATTRLPGTLQAFNAVDMAARVEGRVLTRNFTEGEMVEQGDVLYTLEDDRYAASVNQEKAKLVRARANVDAAEREYGRYAQLLEQNATTAQIVDTRLDDLEVAKAELTAAQANLQAAQVDLDNTVIRAPISGRIGQALADKGQLVKPGSPVVMARITRIDPIYVHVPLDERTYIRFQKSRAQRRAQGLPLPNVSMRLADGTVFPEEGIIDFLSPEQDALGVFDLRVRFDNPEQLLRPGQYAELFLSSPVALPRMIVPQQAVARRQIGDEVKVVREDGVVEVRRVKLGVEIGENWEIEEGLQPGELVVVSGQFKARPDARVEVRELPAPEVPEEFLPPEDGGMRQPSTSELLEGEQ